MDVEDWLGADNQLGIDIWNKKYRYQEESFDEWLDRVCGGDVDLRQLIVDKKFLFGGRILANRGLPEKGVKCTYSNCYVLAPPDDSIESIFETAGKLARTFSYGGGVGIDLSKLAPRGAKINNTALETSGAVSFTDLYSMVTGLIGQHGRRGALMLSMDCNHPDLEEFMKVKTDLDRVTKANMSIRVSNEFMYSVLDNGLYIQQFTRPENGITTSKLLEARKFFRELCDANYDYGEPGCLFWDRIKKWSLLSEFKDFEYAGTNPCGEQPLPAGGSCLLGSINLAEFVVDGKFQVGEFRDAISIAVDALNDVLDEGLALHPLAEQMQSVQDWRQIGLGIMGLADMLIKMEIRYGSEESIKVCDEIASVMIDAALKESAFLSNERGTFAKYNRDAILKSAFFQENAWTGTQISVENYGLRNSQLLTIAPTGTISTMLGVSGGIEPLFATKYTRTTKSLDGQDSTYTVYPKIVEDYIVETGFTVDQLPDYFVTAHEIPYDERVRMQGTWQHHIDASISSTINLPEDFPKEDVQKIYMMAWREGCKGITVFREGCKRDAILTTKAPESRGIIEEVGDNLVGKKRKLMTGCGSLHCTAFFDPNSGKVKEIFLNRGSEGGCMSYLNATSRLASLALRSGCDINEVIEQLQSVSACPSYAVRRATKGDTSKGSCCAGAVANALKEMATEMQCDEVPDLTQTITPTVSIDYQCPMCKSRLVFEGGCNTCKNCGWSRCG